MLPSTKLKVPVKVTHNRALQGLPDKHGYAAGDGLPALVRDAAKFAGVKLPDLFFRSVPHVSGGVLVEGWNGSDGGLTIAIGPMVGPAQPSGLPPERGVAWDVFWAHIEHEANDFRHLVQISHRVDHPPVRHKRDTDEEFAARERTYHEDQAGISAKCGWRTVMFPVAPRYWNASYLEQWIARVLACVPSPESFCQIRLEQRHWRDRDLKAPKWSWLLVVHAYPFTATCRLPLFPEAALVEWLASQEAEIQFKPNLQRLRLLADAPDPIDRTAPKRRERDDDEIGFTPTVIHGGAR